MKRPRYFCENCGTEVGRNARVCPRCGRFFSSIKCPRCEYIGKAEDFAAGCPVCGFAEAVNAPPEPIRPLQSAAAPIPWWVYPLAAAVLLLLLFVLVSILR